MQGFPASKVVWLRKFWASRWEAKRSLLEVNEHLTHKRSTEITNQPTISLKKGNMVRGFLGGGFWEAPKHTLCM